jgi:cyclic dehypoxanthinyl futalosine synthase
MEDNNIKNKILEILELYELPLATLIGKAHELRMKLHPTKEVTWIIDRNVNITNVCVSQCMFCNFCRTKNSNEAYITTIDEYRRKIEELLSIGGNQLLIQGGLHPELGLSFYVNLFSQLKREYPEIKLNALGPPEIVYLAKKEKKSYEDILKTLIDAGLDSLPGAGAEILSDRVRRILSPAKCSSNEWLDVMRIAHRLGLVTTATMVFGHIETIEERIQHLLLIKSLQDEKPSGSYGFLNFILWPMQLVGTRLRKKYNIKPVSISEYVRMLAISRIVLSNIPHIQVSWLTVGKEVAQLCLHAGADDMGSIMIEENVVSSAGATKVIMTTEEMKQTIIEAGFIPRRRNQKFEILD